MKIHFQVVLARHPDGLIAVYIAVIDGREPGFRRVMPDDQIIADRIPRTVFDLNGAAADGQKFIEYILPCAGFFNSSARPRLNQNNSLLLQLSGSRPDHDRIICRASVTFAAQHNPVHIDGYNPGNVIGALAQQNRTAMSVRIGSHGRNQINRRLDVGGIVARQRADFENHRQAENRSISTLIARMAEIREAVSRSIRMINQSPVAVCMQDR